MILNFYSNKYKKSKRNSLFLLHSKISLMSSEQRLDGPRPSHADDCAHARSAQAPIFTIKSTNNYKQKKRLSYNQDALLFSISSKAYPSSTYPPSIIALMITYQSSLLPPQQSPGKHRSLKAPKKNIDSASDEAPWAIYCFASDIVN
jgi:hypothetical protein